MRDKCSGVLGSFLGLLFIGSGCMKIVSPWSFIVASSSLAPTRFISLSVVLLLPLIEIYGGVLLLTRRHIVRVTAALITLVASLTIWTATHAELEGLPCGCFGSFIETHVGAAF
jgi:hypothetical protein